VSRGTKQSIKDALLCVGGEGGGGEVQGRALKLPCLAQEVEVDEVNTKYILLPVIKPSYL
jgi:hypothetical protein